MPPQDRLNSVSIKVKTAPGQAVETKSPKGGHALMSTLTSWPRSLSVAALLFCSVVRLPARTVPARAAPQTAATAVLLVDTDDDCRLIVDDQQEGVLTPTHPGKVEVELGEHLVQCFVDDHPEIIWRKIIEVKDSAQVAVTVELKTIHMQNGGQPPPNPSAPRAAAIPAPAGAAAASARVPRAIGAATRFSGFSRVATRTASSPGRAVRQNTFSQAHSERGSRLPARLCWGARRRNHSRQTVPQVTPLRASRLHISLWS